MQKSVSSARDLAINGAMPLFSEPLHVGRPNIGSRVQFDSLVDAMFERHWLSNDGPLVKQFESELCKFLGVKHCVAMCNGTIALEIATRALDFRGEVIVPSYTFVATAHALQWQEITPVFADIDPATHNLDPASVRKMITPRTTGILGVHLWGRAAPVDELAAIADEFHLKVMYDASHGFGNTLRGVPIGNFGQCEVFSFHATKFFNTFEGGAIVTNDDELAEKTRLMRNFGFVHYDKVIYPGTNGKLTEISAAMGLTNLAALDEFVRVNRRNYDSYKSAFADIPHLNADALRRKRALQFPIHRFRDRQELRASTATSLCERCKPKTSSHDAISGRVATTWNRTGRITPMPACCCPAPWR